MKNVFCFGLLSLGLLLGHSQCYAKPTESGKLGDYYYVDLGLSVKWATYNIGASSCYDSGDLFAWGETSTKSSFSWSNYKWNDGGKLTKYSKTDGIMTLDSKDDVAAVKWGNFWRIPTAQEVNELIGGCDWEWTSDFEGSGIAGNVGKSKKNQNVIFLPAAGFGYDDGLDGKNEIGNYYSSTLFPQSPECAYFLYFDSGFIFLEYRNQRGSGGAIRAVTDK